MCFVGEDTMTGDGGEYLRAEDLRELGDDSLPGHYLDSFSYMNHNLDRSEKVLQPSYETNSALRNVLTESLYSAGHSTLPSTRVSIRETGFSSRTFSRATRSDKSGDVNEVCSCG